MPYTAPSHTQLYARTRHSLGMVEGEEVQSEPNLQIYVVKAQNYITAQQLAVFKLYFMF